MKFFMYKAWRERIALAPKKRFKKALWSQLDVVWQQQMLPQYTWYHKMWFRFSIIATACSVIVGTVSTSVYAYASPNVTENTALYPLKKTLEKVEEKLTPKTPEAQAKLVLKKIYRREAEKAVMQKKQMNVKNIDTKIDRLDDELEKTEVIISASRTEVRKKIDDRLEKRKESVEKNKQRLLDRKIKLEDARAVFVSSTAQGVISTQKFDKQKQRTIRAQVPRKNTNNRGED